MISSQTTIIYDRQILPPASHPPENRIYQEESHSDMAKDSASKNALLTAARILGPSASSTEIANRAGFNSKNSRRLVSYYFGPRRKMFEEAGIAFKTPSERLIEAAKQLPAEAALSHIVSSAGYKSKRSLFFHFDSLEKLKREVGHYSCNKERITYPQVSFSPQDVSKGVTVPEAMTELLAEEIGSHVGDGHLRQKDGKPNYSYTIVGDFTEEKEYFDGHLKSLFKKIYNLEVNPKLLSKGKGYGFTFSSKAIYTYKNSVLGLKTGYKANSVTIPTKILEGSKEIKSAFIRGLADADFSYVFSKKHKDRHYYPTIIGSFASEPLVMQLKAAFIELGFSAGTSSRRRSDNVNYENAIWVKGKEQLTKWMEKIGSNNPKHKTKVEIWKKFGFCPPNTTLEQRKAILAGSLDPNLFYKEELNHA